MIIINKSHVLEFGKEWMVKAALIYKSFNEVLLNQQKLITCINCHELGGGKQILTNKR